MLALLAIIAGSVITGYSAYKIHAIRRGRGRKLRDMEVLRRLDIPPKKQVRVWSVLLVLGLVLLTPGLGYLLAVDPISGGGGDAPYSNLRATSSGTPATVPPSEKLDKTPRTIDDSASSGFFFASSGGGGSSRRSSSGGGGGSSGSSSNEKKLSAVETSLDNDTPHSDVDRSISYAHQINETSEIKATESDPIDQKADEPSETKANDAELEVGEGETDPTTLKDRSLTSAKTEPTLTEPTLTEPTLTEPTLTEPTLTEASTDIAIIGVSREKSTVPAFSGYSTDDIVSDDIGQGSGREESSASPMIVEAASEKRTVPLAPESPIGETVPEPTSEEKPGKPEVSESDRDERPSQDGVVSSDEFLETPPAASLELRDLEAEPKMPETSVAAESSEGEDDPDITRLTSIVEDPAKGESFEIPAAKTVSEPKTDEVKKLVFKEGSTPETNGTANLSANKTGEAQAPVLDGLFADVNMTSGSYAFGGDSDFMSRFQDFTSNAQTGMGTEKNGTLNPVPILEFETIDLRSNFQSGSGLTPTSPFG